MDKGVVAEAGLVSWTAASAVSGTAASLGTGIVALAEASPGLAALGGTEREVAAEMSLRMRGKRISFHVMREKFLVSALCGGKLPGDDEVIKLVSFGGFSSIGFVRFVGGVSPIKTLQAATLRIGKKHLRVLDGMHEQGLLDRARFVVGSVMKNDSEVGKSYGYFGDLESVCSKNGWELAVRTNHAKLLLFDTDAGKFVIETSSNLNENPSVEQFSFEKSAELYDFYETVFDELFARR